MLQLQTKKTMEFQRLYKRAKNISTRYIMAVRRETLLKFASTPSAVVIETPPYQCCFGFTSFTPNVIKRKSIPLYAYIYIKKKKHTTFAMKRVINVCENGPCNISLDICNVNTTVFSEVSWSII